MPVVAAAATITTDRRCYADPTTRADNVLLSGAGFTPNAGYLTTLDGAAFTAGQGTDAGGNISYSFPTPSLDDLVSKGTMEHSFTMGAMEGANAATTTFTVSKLNASFAPASGNPKTLRVKFSVYGFGLSTSGPVDIYLHYVAPNGKLKKTYKLGAGQGDCGSLVSTKRKLFPFKASKGSWKQQLDTASAYKKGTAAGGFLYYTIAVKVS